jgi:hypothetical protein
MMSHQLNNSFIVVNRLLRSNCDVYWLQAPQTATGRDLGTGAIWVTASPAAFSIIEKGAKELGVGAEGMTRPPQALALKLKSVRIGLYDQYGGLITSGWDRWLFEQYEFPFEVVYPQTLDAGDLKNKYDVLVFTGGAFRQPGSVNHESSSNRQPRADEIPQEYRSWLGKITIEKTVPQIEKFLEAGGSVVTTGSSTGLAELLGVPVSDYLSEMGPDGKLRPLPRQKYYIPGSLLRVTIDNSNPLAYGMPKTVDAFFDNSPVFKLRPDAALKHTSAVAWFSGPAPLVGGWAWGQQYLDGGTTVAEALVGNGKLFLLGPEVTFRAQSHASFKFLFNSLYYGSAQTVTLGAQ